MDSILSSVGTGSVLATVCYVLIGAILLDSSWTLVVALLRALALRTLSVFKHNEYRTPPLLKHAVVAVQLPVYNEKHCYTQLIDAACRLNWPSDCLRIQVLDDSTDEEVRRGIDALAARKRAQGHDIVVLRRGNNINFKAGNLDNGLKHCDDAVEYIAIFDADFLPPRDFLERTVPFLEHDARLGFVQTKWSYYNANQNALTRFQEIMQDYHFLHEQRSADTNEHYVQFNGTSTLWRKKAVDQVGGWGTSIVEDMDVSLEAYFHGWRGLYLNDLESPSELPASPKAYLTQQYRWLSGPMHLARGIFRKVLRADLKWTERMYIAYFFIRFSKCFWNTLITFVFIPLLLLAGESVWLLLLLVALTKLEPLLYVPRWRFAPQLIVGRMMMELFWSLALIDGLLGRKRSRIFEVTAKLGSSDAQGIERVLRLRELALGIVYFGIALAEPARLGAWCGFLGTCLIAFATLDWILTPRAMEVPAQELEPALLTELQPGGE